MRNDTVTWFITVGLALFFSLTKVAEGGFFRNTARRAVAAAVFVEAFVNLAQLGLIAELLLLPVLTFLVLFDAVAATQDEGGVVHRATTWLLSLAGICFIGYSVVRLVDDFDAGHTVRALSLPVWLTLGTVPFIYVVGLWSAYQQAFLRIDHFAEDQRHRRRAKLALLRAANIRAADVGGFTRHWISDLASADSSTDARAVMRRWRRSWRPERRAERMSVSRAYMREWLTQPNSALGEVHADALRGSWKRLDREQRATLKAEGLRLAQDDQTRDEIGRLPD